MSKVLITGALGMLGHCIAGRFVREYDVIGWDIADTDGLNPPCQISKIDLTDFDAVEREIEALKPHIVIHTAAMVNVDQCELEPEKSWLFNARVTENLTRAVNRGGGRLIYVSTDAVFDGEKNAPYLELDTVNPLNVYGLSKLEGEKTVLAESKQNTVLRTNIYGWNIQPKTGSVENLLNALRNRQTLKMFTDVLFSPIYTEHFTDFIAAVMEHDLTGLLHAAGGEHCSKHDFAVSLAKMFELDTDCIHRAKQQHVKLPAKRNKNMRLDSTKIAEISGITLPGLPEGLKLFKEDAKRYGKLTNQ